MKKISLNNVKMHVIAISSHSSVSRKTEFLFKQEGNMVTAEYSGGHIKHGFLVGKMDGINLQFSYCQMSCNGELDNGISNCELYHAEDGKLRMAEHFEWKTRPGQSGKNVFEEIK